MLLHFWEADVVLQYLLQGVRGFKGAQLLKAMAMVNYFQGCSQMLAIEESEKRSGRVENALLSYSM